MAKKAGRPASAHKAGRSNSAELLQQALGLFHTRRNEAAALAQQALARAREAGDLSATARALNLLADADRIEGRMGPAAQKAEEALQSALKSGDEPARSDALNNLGLLAWHKGDFASATTWFSESLKLREQLRNDHDIAATCNNLSLVYWEQGDLARAMEHQQRSLAIKERIGDRYGIGVSQLNLGLVYLDLGDWDKALESYFRALAEKEQSRDQADVALCYNNIGEVYLKRGKLDRARFYLDQALALARRAPSLWTEAEVLGNLGEASFNSGDLSLARSCYEQDEAICLKTDDREELTETLRRWAELDLAEGQLDSARARLDRALDICTKVGTRRERGNILRVQAEERWRSGDAAAARGLLDQAATVLRSMGRSYELACCLVRLGQLTAEGGGDGTPLLLEARAILENLGVTAKKEEADRLLGRGAAAGSEVDMLHALAALACRSTDAAGFCRQALELLSDKLAVPGATVFLRDGLVYRHGTAGEVGPGGQNFALEVGGVRVGTLTLAGNVDRRKAQAPAELLSLGLFQVMSRHAAPARAARAAEGRFAGIVGADTTLREVFATVERVAPTKANVLIQGESGTGKELIARTVHQLSERSSRPFLAVNCAAIPETLLESELFGIEKGTATGVAERHGKFEVADGGTLFLDEIGDMSVALQAKLLRVLQERSFERVGGRKPVPVDVRIVAATNRDLEQAMAEGRFRRDLFYRLDVIALTLPPLRKRKQDLPALVAAFVERFRAEYGKPVRGVGDDCLERLLEHDWPGNVRELENAIERGVILCRGDLLTCEDLPPGLSRAGRPDSGWREARKRAKVAAGAAAEREVIAAALEQNRWVIKRSAEKLGMSRRQLYRLMSSYGLSRPGSGVSGRPSVPPARHM